MRNRSYISFFLFNVLLFSFVLGKAQTYPVTSNVVLQPPYSLRLSDYADPVRNTLFTQILVQDLTAVNYPVRIKLSIRSAGALLQTKPEYDPGPLYLTGGIPVQLGNAELAPYFDPENLDFQGISREEFQQTGLLPEGVYQFSLEVFDYNLNTIVSNGGTAVAVLLLNDPPLINTPEHGSKPDARDPQLLNFQWTPRQLSPNSAFVPEYEFRLVEIQPKGSDPYYAMQSQPTIFETTTGQTTLLYGQNAEPLLLPGNEYAFQVRAKQADGLYLFKNDGYSEVHMFTYGDACEPLQGVEAKAQSSTKVRLSWTPQLNHSRYTVRYRGYESNSNWHETSSSLDYAVLQDLQPGSIIEFQVAGMCGTLQADYTPLDTVHLPEGSASAFTCADVGVDFDLNNRTPIQTLQSGNLIYAADFTVEVKEIQQSGERFTGNGLVLVPMLEQLKIKAEFENILVNTDNRLIEGTINVKGAGVQVFNDSITGLITDAWDQLDSTLTAVDSTLENIDELIENSEDFESLIINGILENADLPDEIESAILEALEAYQDKKEELAENGGDASALDAAKETLKDAIGQAKEYLENIKAIIDKLGDLIQEALATIKAKFSKKEEEGVDSLNVSKEGYDEQINAYNAQETYDFGDSDSEVASDPVVVNMNLGGDQDEDAFTVASDAPELDEQIKAFIERSQSIYNQVMQLEMAKFFLTNIEAFLEPENYTRLVDEIKEDLNTTAIEILKLAGQGEEEELKAYLISYITEKIETTFASQEE